jgi:hypothetical protein
MYNSYWPDGDKSTNRNPSTPRPSTVVIARPPKGRYVDGQNKIPRPAGFVDHPSYKD